MDVLSISVSVEITRRMSFLCEAAVVVLTLTVQYMYRTSYDNTIYLPLSFLLELFFLPFPDLQYNLTSDLLHKPSFPHRFYFHGNGSSNSTRGHVRARQGHLTCTTHVAYQRVFTTTHTQICKEHIQNVNMND